MMTVNTQEKKARIDALLAFKILEFYQRKSLFPDFFAENSPMIAVITTARIEKEIRKQNERLKQLSNASVEDVTAAQLITTALRQALFEWRDFHQKIKVH